MIFPCACHINGEEGGINASLSHFRNVELNADGFFIGRNGPAEVSDSTNGICGILDIFVSEADIASTDVCDRWHRYVNQSRGLARAVRKSACLMSFFVFLLHVLRFNQDLRKIDQEHLASGNTDPNHHRLGAVTNRTYQ